MLRPLHLITCASAAALVLGAPSVGGLVAPAQAQVAIGVSASIAPPLLPVYAQPPIPGPGYVFIPGYWAWDGTEYYWVPGYWALPPAADLLWTPGYWAWSDGDYVFNAGYWGPTVGFYGGVDYGFGYSGSGYQGGYWRDHQFYYNQAVNNLGSAHITTVFNQPIHATATDRVSFNGGKGGTTARPTPAEMAAAHQHHIPPSAAQDEHQRAASKMADLRFNANHGQPPIAATERPNDFHGAHIAAAAGAAAGAAAAAHVAAMQHPAARPAAPPLGAQRAPARVAAMHHPAARPTAHPQIVHRAPVTHAPQRLAAHAAPVRPHPAYRPSAMRAPAFHPRVASHAPAPHFAAPHVAATPHFAAPHVASRAPHFAAPHVAGGAPHFAAPHFTGGAPHAGAPHVGGGGPHRAP